MKVINKPAVPVLDFIEQKIQKDDNGIELIHWFI